MRAARVFGGTRPMVEGPCRKFHTSGSGPTTSTVVAVTPYFAISSRNCATTCGVNPPMYPSSDKKQLVKPRSFSTLNFSSGASCGTISSPSSIGFKPPALSICASALSVCNPATTVAAAAPTNSLRFIPASFR